MSIIGLLFLLFVVAIFSAMGRWDTDQRYKRKYKDCCGTNCGCHEENIKNDRNKNNN